MQKEIKAIIFDAARVLMNFDTNIFAKAVRPYSPYEEEEILLKIKSAAALKKFDKGKISAEQFYGELVKILSLKDFSFEKFETEWRKILYWSNEEMEPLLSRIKSDIKLLVLANMDELSWQDFRSFPIIKRFFSDKKQRLASCEMGVAKPEADFYNEALKRFDVPFNQSIFIDDNMENLKQVEKMGGNIIHYDCRTHPIDYLYEEMNKFNVFGIK